MSKYSTSFFKSLEPIIKRDFTFDAMSRICWREYGPLNIIPGNTRFCKDTWSFAVLYAAERYETAFCETLIRQNFNVKKKREVAESDLRGRVRAIIQTQDPLCVIDLTGNNVQRFGIPPSVIRNTDHRSGRAFSKALHDLRDDVDGILFPSRLEDGGVCIAVFERAFFKLDVIATTPMMRLGLTKSLLEKYRISIKPEDGDKDD